MSLSELITLDNSISANMLKIKLENEGISCVLHNENFTNMMPLYFNMLGCGVRVMVQTKNIKRARKIALINPDKLKCPNCGSTKIQNSATLKTNKILFSLIIILLCLPVGNLLTNYFCEICDHRFKE
ncbi:putative signal transducing protein [Aureibacter tunicatorum]|uniref:Ribosomal protein L32 n=1 Tax=Aureibacter tunicatorum TaxID=866807 RepID=A0AAE4BV55_9BACT|nr:DUF2007 domain-containing protein [Aureibacter tunicatorum]MDR6241735.1 ribosomal protein L32 [Aureibacter tunicatorum]BDD07403.1 hypothetical protein AUTU_48860 [Aureibacter tunicatorum]